jgi:hypothetical protein
MHAPVVWWCSVIDTPALPPRLEDTSSLGSVARAGTSAAPIARLCAVA